MIALKLKPQHETTVIGQIIDANRAVNYHNENTAPFYNQMEKWEMKEYKSVNDDNIAKIKILKDTLISNESLFNNLLSEYNLTTTIFIARYINN